MASDRLRHTVKVLMPCSICFAEHPEQLDGQIAFEKSVFVPHPGGNEYSTVQALRAQALHANLDLSVGRFQPNPKKATLWSLPYRSSLCLGWRQVNSPSALR